MSNKTAVKTTNRPNTPGGFFGTASVVVSDQSPEQVVFQEDVDFAATWQDRISRTLLFPTVPWLQIVIMPVAVILGLHYGVFDYIPVKNVVISGRTINDLWWNVWVLVMALIVFFTSVRPGFVLAGFMSKLRQRIPDLDDIADISRDPLPSDSEYSKKTPTKKIHSVFLHALKVLFKVEDAHHNPIGVDALRTEANASHKAVLVRNTTRSSPNTPPWLAEEGVAVPDPPTVVREGGKLLTGMSEDQSSTPEGQTRSLLRILIWVVIILGIVAITTIVNTVNNVLKNPTALVIGLAVVVALVFVYTQKSPKKATDVAAVPAKNKLSAHKKPQKKKAKKNSGNSAVPLVLIVVVVAVLAWKWDVVQPWLQTTFPQATFLGTPQTAATPVPEPGLMVSADLEAPSQVMLDPVFGQGFQEVEVVAVAIGKNVEMLITASNTLETSGQSVFDWSVFLEGSTGSPGLRQVSSDIDCWATLGNCTLSTGLYLQTSFEMRVEGMNYNNTLDDRQLTYLNQSAKLLADAENSLLLLVEDLSQITRELKSNPDASVAKLWANAQFHANLYDDSVMVYNRNVNEVFQLGGGTALNGSAAQGTPYELPYLVSVVEKLQQMSQRRGVTSDNIGQIPLPVAYSPPPEVSTPAVVSSCSLSAPDRANLMMGDLNQLSIYAGTLGQDYIASYSECPDNPEYLRINLTNPSGQSAWELVNITTTFMLSDYGILPGTLFRAGSSGGFEVISGQ